MQNGKQTIGKNGKGNASQNGKHIVSRMASGWPWDVGHVGHANRVRWPALLATWPRASARQHRPSMWVMLA